MDRSHSTLPATARGLARWLRHPTVRHDSMAEWRRRIRRRPPPLPEGPIRRVLTVCHGNIARSPFSAALLTARAPHLQIRSGGLEAVEGRRADEAALRVAARFDMDLAAHGAHRIRAEDVAWADLILAMQGHQVVEIVRRWPEARAKASLLGHFLNEPPFGIADPWGRGDEVFVLTFQSIDRAVDRLVALLQDPSG